MVRPPIRRKVTQTIRHRFKQTKSHIDTAKRKAAVSPWFRPRSGPLSLWVIFLMAPTVPPSFVDNGPKLRVLNIAKWEWPKRPKTGESPKKWPLARKRKFFWGWFRWESCSPGYSGHLFHQQKSRSLNKKLTFGPKYPNFGVKKAHFCP